jgi:hypothetical protein
MTRIVYVVICYWGQYEDYTEEIVKSFYKKEDAEIYKTNKEHNRPKHSSLKYKIIETELEK